MKFFWVLLLRYELFKLCTIRFAKFSAGCCCEYLIKSTNIPYYLTLCFGVFFLSNVLFGITPFFYISLGFMLASEYIRGLLWKFVK